jgi:hypothetical protein
MDFQSAFVEPIHDFKTMLDGWLTKFSKKLSKRFNDFMKRLRKLFEWLPNAIKRVASGGGFTIGGTTGQVAEGIKSLYSAKGGVVPLYAANGAFVPRGTDTVPAMLTPGERVLTVNQNESFEALPMILAQLVTVLSSPMTTETTIDIDGNRLADVILQLNRRNARVA